MSNIFNASRFQQLFRKHTFENYRNYVMSIAVLFGMLAIVYLLFIVGSTSNTIKLRIIGLISIYLFAGSIFTSSVFADFTGKRRAIFSLTLPASHFEKYLVGWVFSFLIFTVIYLIIYAIVDYSFIPFSLSDDKRTLITLINQGHFPSGMFLYYAFLHSVMIYGAIRFQNAHFIKTATALFIAILVLCTSHAWFLESLISEELGFTLPLMNIITNNTSVILRVRLEEYEKFIYTGLISIGFAITLWTAAYYSLKEKVI